MLSRTTENFVSPRHRHNFEQIRFQIEGVSDFGRDGQMVPGTMGYFPEGAFYGPQSAAGPALVLVLQFGGPSGSGYMSEDDLQRSVALLSTQGEFRAGVFYRNEGQPGRPRQDAYEAAWENHNGRTLQYPEPLYAAPKLIASADIAWQPVAPGVSVKPLGAFTGGTAVNVIRLEAGADHTITGRSVLFVTEGAGIVDRAAIEQEASLAVDARETVTLRTETGIEVLAMHLPLLDAVNGAATMAA
jgi:hypothetical protein